MPAIRSALQPLLCVDPRRIAYHLLLGFELVLDAQRIAPGEAATEIGAITGLAVRGCGAHPRIIGQAATDSVDICSTDHVIHAEQRHEDRTPNLSSSYEHVVVQKKLHARMRLIARGSEALSVRSAIGPVARFIGRRLAIGLLTIWAISVLSFTIIQLPPGDFASNYIAQISQGGGIGSPEDIARLRADLGLDGPAYMRYGHWIWNILHGDLGRSLTLARPVGELITERLGLTLLVAVGGLLFAWAFALPIGIYCAVRRGSPGAYLFTLLGLIGMAIPPFLLSLFAMYVAFRYFNVDLGQVQSPQYLDAPWSVGKTLDLIRHLVLPTAILGLATMTRLFRILRANLLDEIGKPYVVTARAKGMRELALILKYPTRIALNPFVSTIGLALPQLVSGSLIISLVMSLPTLGPLLLQALQAQDMFLAGAIMLVLATLTVVGMLLSDLLLAWLDPRIRLES